MFSTALHIATGMVLLALIHTFAPMDQLNSEMCPTVSAMGESSAIGWYSETLMRTLLSI